MDFIFKKIKAMNDKLNSLRTVKSTPLDYYYTDTVGYKKGNYPKSDVTWYPAPENHIFGGVDEHRWIKVAVNSTPKADGKELRLSVRTGRESQWDARNVQFLVYIDGKAVGAFDTKHTWLPLEFEREYEIYLYLYTGLVGGTFNIDFSLNIVDVETEALYYDINVPFSVLKVLDEKSEDYIKIRDCLDKALLYLDLRYAHSSDYYRGIEDARRYLKEEFYGKICGKSERILSCIGHTHIDVAWRWTVQQSREKAQRSFATVINMMKRYKDYKFMSSQPQLYDFVKQEDPELYAEIKKAVKDGRWEVEGAMWLEADTNLASGESLIRQIIFGKRFMKEEFGVDSKILWLPDVFGYSAALPQIMQKCGVDKFFTTKMEWNESNKMPNDVFVWEGIDGSKVFTIFEPLYAAELNPKFAFDFDNKFKNKSLTSHEIITFGFADGGGGPTYEMMENFERLKYGIPSMPKAVMQTAGEFFYDVKKEFDKNTEELKVMPKWLGEMYLETHRGTLTSMAKNKKYNRKSELLYMAAEASAVMAEIYCNKPYPQKLFNENIEKILLNQFHDIIPGSSIKEVYDVSDREYEEILKNGEKILDDSLTQITNSINCDDGIFVYNPSPFERSEYIGFDGELYYADKIMPHGYRVIPKKAAKQEVGVSDFCIENDKIKVSFDENYNIVSVFDKEEEREVIEEGKKANRLVIYEDYPWIYDAWDIAKYYNQKKWYIDAFETAEFLQNGIKITRKYQSSLITQEITLSKGSKRIDFKTFVDWKEDHVLLKTEFPVAIRNDEAVYDIQFGNIKRPTHKNTSWDEAKFEVCGHKWADLSEGNYGVSLLNDCKYGYSIYENTMALSLLKAATDPNPQADRCTHEFTYSLYPHTSDFKGGRTVQEGYALNMPLVVREIKKSNGTMPDSYSFIRSNRDNIVIETVKKSEDGNDVIVRLYDAHNIKCNADIIAGFDYKEVYLCDMLENNIEKLDSKNGVTTVKVGNFEIVTLKFCTK